MSTQYNIISYSKGLPCRRLRRCLDQRPGTAFCTYMETNRLTAFEHIPHAHDNGAQNILIFVAGLFDGLMTVDYPSSISDALPPDWTLAQVVLSSSYNGWGTSSLQKDVEELSQCVSYFRGLKAGKIILMGHSTGCQDLMEYLTGFGHETRAPIDGGILQGPVSDRESILMTMDQATYDTSCETARSMIETGRGNEIVPSKFIENFPCPVTATRWLSLASPDHNGDDDHFSSDLTDERLMRSFGALPAGTPICILFSGADEWVPPHVDPKTLLERWITITNRGHGIIDGENSGVINSASHNLNGNPEVVVQDLVKRILNFLAGIPIWDL